MSTANTIAALAGAPLTSQLSSKAQPSSWFEAMAQAWGQALDKQAETIQQKSDAINQTGNDTPSSISDLTAASMKMGFLSNSSHSSISAVSEALNAVARKS